MNLGQDKLDWSKEIWHALTQIFLPRIFKI